MKANGPREIAFVPPITNPVFTEDFDDFMPLGLLALAASLRANGFDAALFRPAFSLLNQQSYDRAASEILQMKCQVVGFSTWCHSYASSLLLAKAIKDQSPQTIVLFGGPQATILDEETLKQFRYVDYVLRGEADKTVVQFMNALRKSDNSFSTVPGLTFRDSENIITNPAPSFLSELDELPIPAYDLVSPNQEYVSLDVGRGCPFKCTFCTTNDFFSKSYRVKSADRIIQEMDHIFANYGITKFDFTHDMFTLNRKFLIPFFQKLRQHYASTGVSYTWTCSARLDCVTPDLIQDMAASGCKGIFFGVESGSQRMQKLIKKNVRVDRGYTVIDSCSEYGIRSTSAFIAGFPEEERSDIDSTIKAIFEMTVRGAKPQMSLLSLLPQTPLYEAHRNSLVFDGHLSDFSGAALSTEELEIIKLWPHLFSSFYYLPISAANRDTLVSLSAFVNHLQDFRRTVRVIWRMLESDLQAGSFLDFFERKRLKLRRYINMEVVGIIRTLDLYIKRKMSPTAFARVRTIFLTEAALATVKRKYVTWQIIHPEHRRPSNSLIAASAKADHIKINVNPYFKIFQTDCNLIEALESTDAESSEPATGAYYYMAVADNERSGRIVELSKNQRDTIVNLASMDQSALTDILARGISSGVIDRLMSLGIVRLDLYTETDMRREAA
jgi:radical SAM superfamily enzyme YgiQ (UPF0313 family)